MLLEEFSFFEPPFADLEPPEIEGPFSDPLDISGQINTNRHKKTEVNGADIAPPIVAQSVPKPAAENHRKSDAVGVNDETPEVQERPGGMAPTAENDIGFVSGSQSKKIGADETNDSLPTVLAIGFGAATGLAGVLAGAAWIKQSINSLWRWPGPADPSFHSGVHELTAGRVRADGSAKVDVVDSLIDASGDAIVSGRGISQVRAGGNVEVSLYDKAAGVVSGDSVTLAYGDGNKVWATDRAFVVNLGKGRVHASNDAVVLLEDGSATADQNCVILGRGPAKIEVSGKAQAFQSRGSTGPLLVQEDARAKTETSGRVIVRNRGKVDHGGTGSVDASGESEVNTTGRFVRGSQNAVISSRDAEELILTGKASADARNVATVSLHEESVLRDGQSLGLVTVTDAARATIHSARCVSVGDRGQVEFLGSEGNECQMFLDGTARAHIKSGVIDAQLMGKSDLLVAEKVKGNIVVKDQSSLKTSGDNIITVENKGSVEASGQATIKVSASQTEGEIATVKLSSRFRGALEVNGNAKLELSGNRDILVNEGVVEISCKNFTGRLFVRGGKVSCRGTAEIVASGSAELEYSGEPGERCVIYAKDQVKLRCEGDRGLIRAGGECKVDAKFRNLELYASETVTGVIKAAEGKVMLQGKCDLITGGEIITYAYDDSTLTVGEGGTCFRYDRAFIRGRPGSAVHAEFDSASVKMAEGARLFIRPKMPPREVMPTMKAPTYTSAESAPDAIPGTESRSNPTAAKSPSSGTSDDPMRPGLSEVTNRLAPARDSRTVSDGGVIPKPQFATLAKLVRSDEGLTSLQTLWKDSIKDKAFDFKDNAAAERWVSEALQTQFGVTLTEQQGIGVKRLTRRLLLDNWHELSIDPYLTDGISPATRIGDQQAGKANFDDFQTYLDRYMMKRANKPQFAQELIMLLSGEGERLSDKLGLYVKDANGKRQYLFAEAIELADLGGGGAFDRSRLGLLLDVSRGEGVGLLAHELAHFERELQALALKKADPKAFDNAVLEGVLSNTGNGQQRALYKDKTGEPSFLWRLHLEGEGLDLMREMLRTYIKSNESKNDTAFLSEKAIEEFVNSNKADPRFGTLLRDAFDKSGTLLNEFRLELLHYRAVVDFTQTPARFLEQEPANPAAAERLAKIKQWIHERAENYARARQSRGGSLEGHPRMVENAKSASSTLDGIFGSSPEVGGSSWNDVYRSASSETAAYRFQLIEQTRGWMMEKGYSMPDALRPQLKMIRFFDEISRKLEESRTAATSEGKESALLDAKLLAQKMLKEGLPENTGSRRTALLFLSHNKLIEDSDVVERDFNLMLYGRRIEISKTFMFGPLMRGAPILQDIEGTDQNKSDNSKPGPQESKPQQPIETQRETMQRPGADELFDDPVSLRTRPQDRMSEKPLDLDTIEGPNGLRILADKVSGRGRELAKRMEQFNSDKAFQEMLEREIKQAKEDTKERKALEQELEKYRSLTGQERDLTRQRTLREAIDLHNARMEGHSPGRTALEVFGVAGTVIAVGMLAELILANCQSGSTTYSVPANPTIR